MTSFLIALAVLVGGYIVYGLVMDRVLGIDPARPTPCKEHADGIDYVPMSPWRVFLIQFLNIAGLGPIFGAIMGVMFGPAAFIWISLGTIFGGAVHDFTAAVISLRHNGASLPEIIGRELGSGVKQLMRVFAVLLLLLVGAVFVITPAGLLADMTPAWCGVNFWICVIFAYYLAATLLPVDKLIGRFYPLFGLALLFMALGMLGVMLFGNTTIPLDFGDGLWSRHPAADTHPLFPMMFVSIACGAISGFHATQSPMMARCLTNERLARPVFYGAMVAEGIVALIWAAAAIAFTGGYEQLAAYMGAGGSAGSLVKEISFGWLGAAGGVLAVLGVIVAPVTSGDTALRSVRLMVADMLHLDQTKLRPRLLVTLPLFALVFGLMMMDFNVLWRYFAWANQTMSVFTLWACTVWLARHHRPYIVTLLPALFMTVVSVSYLLCAPSPEGFGLDPALSTGVGAVVAVTFLGLFTFKQIRRPAVEPKM